jgi:hypothetical protein
MPHLNLYGSWIVALVGLFASMATVAEGQGLDSVPANARVRVDFPAADRSRFDHMRLGRVREQSIIGTIQAVRADTLVLLVESGTEPLRVPRSAIRSLYVSGGRPPRWRAALGGAAMPAFVAAALSAAGGSIHRREGDPSLSEMALSSAIWAGASGAVLGAWRPKERWRPVVAPRPSPR